MTKHLDELFTDSLARDEHHVAHHPLLMLRKDSLAEVMRFTERTPDASYAIAPLREMFAVDSWWGDAQKLEKFFQLSGELQFWMLAEAKGVPITRVPEAKKKMPDFRLNSGAAWAPSFEVKTLSVAAGFRNIDAMMDGAVDSQIDLDAQQKRGVTFATSEQELTTHGHTDFERVVTTMCRNLIDKTQNNIKGGQYSAATTFLVLNLMLIDSARTGNSMLRPVTPGWPNAWSVNTGVLWTLGFGHVDQFVHSEPEFEGKPAIEGRLGRQGILENPDYQDVKGILFVVHSHRGAAIYGLWRSKDHTYWWDHEQDLAQVLVKLTQNNYNDELDTYGFNLTESP